MESSQAIFKSVQQKSRQLSSWLQPSRRLQGHCGKANAGFSAAVSGSAPSLTIVYGLSPPAVRKAFASLSSARLHSYIRPCCGLCPGHSVVRTAGAKRSSDPEDHDCYRPCSAAGLACSDSLASHHNHQKTITSLLTPSSGSGALPVAAESPFVAPHRPADPHQFVG